MSTTCPYRHVSYASWRYQALRSLFKSAKELPAFPAILPRPALLPNACRKFSDSAHALKSDEERKPRNGPTDAQFSKDEGVQGYYTKKLLLYDTRNELKLSENDRNEKNKKLKGNYVTKRWSPLDGRGKEDLMALTDSLQEASGSINSISDAQDATSGDGKPSNRLPQSPLVLALAKEKPKKQKVKGVYNNELANNPWARMLASPIRYCPVTGVRLPSDLLVPWGLVRNPTTQDVYFMPAELAELDKLKDKRTKSKKASSSTTQDGNQEGSSYTQSPTTTRNTDADSVPPSKDEGVWPGSDSPDAPTYLPKVNILPLQSLLQHLTLNYTFVNNKSGQRESHNNVVGRMVPWRWNQALERAKFYRDRRRIAAGRPPLSKAEQSNILSDFKYVRWDPEIDQKMLRILRERVLVALEGLGKRNQKLWEQGKELVKARPFAPGAQFPGAFNSEDDFPGATDEVKEHHLKSSKMCLVVDPDRYDEVNLRIEAGMEAEQLTSGEVAIALEPSGLHKVASNQVPIFPLTDLFGQEYALRFINLTKTTGVLAPRGWTTGQGGAYSLVFPATAHGGNVVFVEIWRLWRYLGGKMNSAQSN